MGMRVKFTLFAACCLGGLRLGPADAQAQRTVRAGPPDAALNEGFDKVAYAEYENETQYINAQFAFCDKEFSAQPERLELCNYYWSGVVDVATKHLNSTFKQAHLHIMKASNQHIPDAELDVEPYRDTFYKESLKNCRIAVDPKACQKYWKELLIMAARNGSSVSDEHQSRLSGIGR